MSGACCPDDSMDDSRILNRPPKKKQTTMSELDDHNWSTSNTSLRIRRVLRTTTIDRPEPCRISQAPRRSRRDRLTRSSSRLSSPTDADQRPLRPLALSPRASARENKNRAPPNGTVLGSHRQSRPVRSHQALLSGRGGIPKAAIDRISGTDGRPTRAGSGGLSLFRSLKLGPKQAGGLK